MLLMVMRGNWLLVRFPSITGSLETHRAALGVTSPVSIRLVLCTCDSLYWQLETGCGLGICMPADWEWRDWDPQDSYWLGQVLERSCLHVFLQVHFHPIQPERRAGWGLCCYLCLCEHWVSFIVYTYASYVCACWECIFFHFPAAVCGHSAVAAASPLLGCLYVFL